MSGHKIHLSGFLCSGFFKSFEYVGENSIHFLNTIAFVICFLGQNWLDPTIIQSVKCARSERGTVRSRAKGILGEEMRTSRDFMS